MATDEGSLTHEALEDFLSAIQDRAFQHELADRLNDALASEMPELADVTLRSTFDASTRSLAAELFHLYATDLTSTLTVPPAALEFARALAVRRHDVVVLLRAYRIGQRLTWAELFRLLADKVPDPELRIQVLTRLLERISLELERVVEACVEVFTEERDRWLSGTMARKADLVATILNGDPVDAGEATRALGHRLLRHQLAVLFWVDGSGPERDALSRLERAARDVATRLGTPPPLTLPHGTRSLRAWVELSANPDLGALAELSWEGLHAAAGLPAYGVDGFRASHRQALLASRVAQASDAPAAVTSYDDVALVAAFLDDRTAMHDLIVRELGSLTRRETAAQRLRETALAYLRAGGSARDAAEAISVHKNTVLYRLRGIDEALGHPIDERRLPLEIALTLVETLGDGVLAEP